MGALKNSLKKILPPPVNSFMREVNRIVALEEKNQKAIDKLTEIEMQNQQTIDKLIMKVEQQEQQIQVLQNAMNVQTKIQQTDMAALQNDMMQSQKEQIMLLNDISELQNMYSESYEKKTQLQQQLLEQLKQQQEVIKADVKVARNHAWKSQKNSDEILWAEIFHDASSNSTWLHDKAFSAGRWAVGYQYLYSVYRILDEVKPKNILELGLGQSTRLLGQYASENVDVSHTVVEHDLSWIEFFQQDFPLGDNTNIVQLEREYIKFCEDEKVLAFKDFYETFEGLKFDFISIDAPLGGEAIVYARIDILNLLPECLAESFVIVVDDYNRFGEKNMVAMLETILKENDISYVKGIYSGQKDCVVICSENLKFVCSM